MLEKLKEFFKTIQGRGTIFIVVLGILVGAWFIYSFIEFQQMVMLPAGLTKAVLGIMLLLAYDGLVLKDTNTNEMVKQDNNWGLLMVALAIIYAGSLQ